MQVYKTTNKINGKFYIGQDTHDDPNYYGSGVAIVNAIKFYGKLNFFKEVLQVCNTIDELNQAEIEWISKLDANNRKIAYNIQPGGNQKDSYTNNPNREEILRKLIESNARVNNDPVLSKAKQDKTTETKMKNGTHPSLPGMKKKYSEANKGRVFTEDTCKKISEANKGKAKTEEHKKKLSLAKKGKPSSNKGKKMSKEGIDNIKSSWTDNRRVKHSQIFSGRIVSEETKKKISESKIGKPGTPHTEDSKKKISEANKGKIFSEESRKKMSESSRGQTAWNKGIPCTEETKEKIRQSILSKREKNEAKIKDD